MNFNSITIFYSEDDKCYIAHLTHHPSISAWGDTEEVAYEELKIAIDGVKEIYEEDNS